MRKNDLQAAYILIYNSYLGTSQRNTFTLFTYINMEIDTTTFTRRPLYSLCIVVDYVLKPSLSSPGLIILTVTCGRCTPQRDPSSVR